MSSDGTSLIFSTYLGNSGYDGGAGIAMDSAGNLYLSGGTSGSDFPVTRQVFQPVSGGGTDLFIAKIQFAAAFTTGVLNNIISVSRAASAAMLIINNDSLINWAAIQIAAFFLSGTRRVAFASERIPVPPLSTLARGYDVGTYQSFEIQYELTGPGNVDMVINVFPVDEHGNLQPDLRVLHAKAKPIFMLTQAD